MENLEFQWLILKIDETVAKNWKTNNSSAILLLLTILYRSIVLCWDMKNLKFQWLILKFD